MRVVVEDETRMAPLVKRGLEEEGHAVDVACDGPEGLWLVGGIRGVVLTRSQILDAAWDFAYDGSSNLLEQYVNGLAAMTPK